MFWTPLLWSVPVMSSNNWDEPIQKLKHPSTSNRRIIMAPTIIDMSIITTASTLSHESLFSPPHHEDYYTTTGGTYSSWPMMISTLRTVDPKEQKFRIPSPSSSTLSSTPSDREFCSHIYTRTVRCLLYYDVSRIFSSCVSFPLMFFFPLRTWTASSCFSQRDFSCDVVSGVSRV